MAGPFGPSEKRECEELIKAVLGTFTTQYTKHYALALVKKKEKDANKPPKYLKLDKRKPPTDDLKSGYLTKEGGVRKSWKKRWFVVHHDYTVDYFADEKTAQKPKAKPKGSIGLCGYYVTEDLGNALLKRVKDLADKMGMDVSALPGPKTYPELCFEVYHYRRRSYYIEAATKEEKDEWVEMFKTACRRAYGLRDKDKVHIRAFNNAVTHTRWELGRWGYGSYGGTEEQILTDIISDEIDWTVMGRVYNKISGPWMIRNGIRNTIIKTLDTLVSAAVTPGWKGMSTAVGELRPKIEPVIGEMVTPLAEQKQKIMDKIKEGALSQINPLMDEHVIPHLSKIIEIITSPMREGFAISLNLWEEQMTKYAETFDAANFQKPFKDFLWYPRSWWNLRGAYEKVEAMYDPLWLLREIFSDIYPWSLIWTGRDYISGTMDNAFFTFENHLKKNLEENPSAGKEAVDAARSAALEKYKHDIEWLTVDYYMHILKCIIMPPFNKIVIPVGKAILEPIQDMIPDAMKQFIDLQEMFTELVNGIIEGVIKNVLEKA